MRWIWIDRFVSFESGNAAVATKNLSLAEDHFADHMPGYPVMPAPLILEGLAQTGGILVGEANNYTRNVVLAKIPKAHFRRDALAGETLTYTVTLSQLSDIGGVVNGTVDAGDERIGEAEIFFAHVGPEQLKELTGADNFVFTGNLQKMLGMAKAAAKKTEPSPTAMEHG
jgi:3-hydroxyacyl-[acyl-carrier-protein] dehydratase